MFGRRKREARKVQLATVEIIELDPVKNEVFVSVVLTGKPPKKGWLNVGGHISITEER
jgi:hypothetical protein